MKEFKISSAEEGQRLNKYLKRLMSLISDPFIFKMLRKKNITVNGKSAKAGDILKEGDIVKIFFSDETFARFCGEPDSEDLDIYKDAFGSLKGIRTVYEDDDMIVFFKPYGILSQKASKEDLSLNEYLIGYLLDNGRIDKTTLAHFRPSIMNRLDRNTQGLVMCSKSLKGAKTLSYLIRDRSIKKYYRTVCKGKIDKESTVTGFLIKDEKTNKVTVYEENREGAKKIVTRMIPRRIEDDRTYTDIELITGKTHQIRAHLAFIGHPVLGDTKYGDPSFNKKYDRYNQELTAYKLVFPSKCDIPGWNDLVIEV
ncbi:MAG: RluA family pseudouridine synthase [Lachnospiraceae bacterium]|nr:RluA family pseudouridine synthase [Lachnospiraceae bacterium]